MLFQLTRSRGAWPMTSLSRVTSTAFQLTRSRGAWRYGILREFTQNSFQLTRSRGAWLADCISQKVLIHISTHTLTWSVTNDPYKIMVKDYHFNSHAHVERDGRKWKNCTWIYISTHTLTWSVTFFLCRFFLTFCYFNSHAHVERDTRFTTLPLYYTNFNSHAHVERDSNKNGKSRFKKISTHTLTWSVTARLYHLQFPIAISTHTLTWSVT